MKKLHTYLLLIGIVCFAGLVWKSGVRELWMQLRSLGWRIIPLILAEGFAEMCHAISWRYCFRRLHRTTPLPRFFTIHFAGYAVNFLTPTASVAGEVTKAAFLAKDTKNSEAISAVLIGKLSFALGHLCLVAVGTIFLLPRLEFSPYLRAVLVISSVLLTVGIIGFLLVQKMGRLGSIVNWAVKLSRGKKFQNFGAQIADVDEALAAFYRDQPFDLFVSVLWHLLGYSVGIFSTWYYIDNIAGGAAAVSVAVGIWFLTLWFDLVTFAVPFNLGVLEGGRIVAFRAFGFKTLPGMTFGVVTRLAQIFWSGIGLLNYALLLTTNKVKNENDCFATSNERLRA